MSLEDVYYFNDDGIFPRYEYARRIESTSRQDIYLCLSVMEGYIWDDHKETNIIVKGIVKYRIIKVVLPDTILKLHFREVKAGDSYMIPDILRHKLDSKVMDIKTLCEGRVGECRGLGSLISMGGKRNVDKKRKGS